MIEKVVHVYSKHYSAIKRNEILLLETTLMGQEGIMLSEIAQKPYYFTYM